MEPMRYIQVSGRLKRKNDRQGNSKVNGNFVEKANIAIPIIVPTRNESLHLSGKKLQDYNPGRS
uniref:Uncharacterized protein n=1 Tax=Oryza nivara TaxID=4536 RepID=A0A0E0J4G9_ORYNI